MNIEGGSLAEFVGLKPSFKIGPINVSGIGTNEIRLRKPKDKDCRSLLTKRWCGRVWLSNNPSMLSISQKQTSKPSRVSTKPLLRLRLLCLRDKVVRGMETETTEMDVMEEDAEAHPLTNSLRRFALKNSIQTNFGNDYVFQIVARWRFFFCFPFLGSQTRLWLYLTWLDFSKGWLDGDGGVTVDKRSEAVLTGDRSVPRRVPRSHYHHKPNLFLRSWWLSSSAFLLYWWNHQSLGHQDFQSGTIFYMPLGMYYDGECIQGIRFFNSFFCYWYCRYYA